MILAKATPFSSKVNIKAVAIHINERKLSGMAAMAARSIWKGSISFGLVNIPIQVFSATQKDYTSFNQLCEKGHKSIPLDQLQSLISLLLQQIES